MPLNFQSCWCLTTLVLRGCQREVPLSGNLFLTPYVSRFFPIPPTQQQVANGLLTEEDIRIK